jgi:hypothetical protein
LKADIVEKREVEVCGRKAVIDLLEKKEEVVVASNVRERIRINWGGRGGWGVVDG